MNDVWKTVKSMKAANYHQLYYDDDDVLKKTSTHTHSNHFIGSSLWLKRTGLRYLFFFSMAKISLNELRWKRRKKNSCHFHHHTIFHLIPFIIVFVRLKIFFFFGDDDDDEICQPTKEFWIKLNEKWNKVSLCVCVCEWIMN